eukprot:2106256-Rhodomonas_salina.1
MALGGAVQAALLVVASIIQVSRCCCVCGAYRHSVRNVHHAIAVHRRVAVRRREVGKRDGDDEASGRNGAHALREGAIPPVLLAVLMTVVAAVAGASGSSPTNKRLLACSVCFSRMFQAVTATLELTSSCARRECRARVRAVAAVRDGRRRAHLTAALHDGARRRGCDAELRH